MTWPIYNGDVELMSKVCEFGKIHGYTTPLCNNWNMWWDLKKISADKNVSFELMLWISYAESHIWANFNPQKCRIHNNRWGKKAKKLDGWSMVRVKLPLSDWCWLYHFKTVEEYRNSFANVLRLWYIDKWCKSPECISQYYVGTNWLVKDWRSKNVRKFYQ